MDLIEDIGPILGIAAFLGFAILALLIVLQAREVRRLREWAGRAPERSLDADDANQAVLDARGETSDSETPGFIARTRTKLAATVGPRWEELNRRSPVNPGWFIAVLLAGLIATGVLTSGFGLTGDDPDPVAVGTDNGDRKNREGPDPAEEPDAPVEVAVLNATQVDDPVVPVSGVPGLANVIGRQVVEPAGFSVGARTDAPAGEEASVIMYQADAETDAGELAAAVEEMLGAVETVPITPEVAGLAKGAPLVLLVGQDDASFGQGAATTTAP